MKLITSILILVLLSNKSLKAQSVGVSDTLAYLKAIEANKSQYVGKPFSLLQDSLKIGIKFFSPFAANTAYIDRETSTSFAFYFPQSSGDHYLSYPRLEIDWQYPLNARESNVLFDNSNGAWTSTTIFFYSIGIIANIKVIE